MRLLELWEQDNGQALDEQQKHQFDDMQQQILDETTSEQTRRALAGFGLNADELRQKLLPPATPITHIHLYHCDHLGTPQALIDPLGQVDWQIELDPWGNTRKEYNRLKLRQPIRMQGQHLDEASGLFYNWYRYYDPGLGRYISPDPIGLNGGVNFYIYPLDPMGWIDPHGLAACKVMFLDMSMDKGVGFEVTWIGGHGGILAYDRKGKTQYYEYGRYPSYQAIGVGVVKEDRNFRRVTVPNINVGTDGQPTPESKKYWRMLFPRAQEKVQQRC